MQILPIQSLIRRLYTQVKHMDEVFEAFISARNVDPSELGFEDNFISKEEVGEVSNNFL